MQKIMFNDLYCLTDAAIEGYKTNTRRIEGKDQFQEMAACADQIFYNEDTGLIDFMFEGIDIFNHKPRYKVGEIVSVAQSYENAGVDPEYPIEGVQLAKEHAGWRNKMFVSAKLMPYRIRITGVRCERLQDISDEECMKEGVVDVTYFKTGGRPYELFALPGHEYEETFNTPRQAFASLIDKVSGRGTWKSNPWVVVYEFELVK